MDLLKIFKRGAKRRARQVLVRGFDSAKAGRLFSSWSTSGVSIDDDLKNDLASLRARSRDQFLNNDFVRRYVEMVRANVVGPKGVVLQSAVKDPNGQEDRFAANAIEEAWRDWGRAEHCDYEESIGWVEKQGQAIGGIAIDGEIFARLLFGKSYGKYGFMVQHLDPAMLNEQHNKKLSGGRFIRMGIEYDSRRRRVAYYILTNGDTQAAYSFGGRRYSRVPASQIIHTFRPLQVGQSRGYPWLSTSLGSLKMLDAYFEAALTAARAGAAKMGFIQSQDGAGYSGDGIDEDGSIISDFEAGTIEQLPDGMTFTPFDPKYPHEQFDTFTQTFLRRISASGGVSYSALTGDLTGVSFSSIRSGVLEEREMWKGLQGWFIEGYIRPIFEGWLSAALLGGHIQIMGKPLKAFNEEKYRRANWQARRWAWVDPKKDTESNISQIENNLTTASAIIREQGNDPEEVFQERARENERLKELGLSETDVMEQADGLDDEHTEGAQVDVKEALDTYGVGVRAGAFSPQKSDEVYLRQISKLPEISKEVDESWNEIGGVKRPITMALPGDPELDAEAGEHESEVAEGGEPESTE